MKRWDRAAAWGMLLPPSLIIGFYIYIGSFNRMLSDDYCSMFQAQNLGLLRSIWFWYLTWHGRFSANVADWLLSLWGSNGFPFFTLVFLSLWVGFTVMAAREVLRFRGYPPSSLFPAFLLGVFLVFITILISPDIEQSVFWWGGARSYLSSPILILLYFVLCYRFMASSPARLQTGIWLFISCGFAFLIGGFSETFAPLLVLLLAGLLGVIGLRPMSDTRGRALLFLSAGFLGALSALVVMVLAPGNAVRQAFYPAPPDPVTLLRIAFAGYFAFLGRILSSPALLAGFAGTTLGSVWLGNRMDRGYGVTAPRGGWVILLLFAGLSLAFGCFPPSAYATSTPPPPRALIVAAFFLVLFFLAAGFVLGEWLASRTTGSSSWATALLAIACSLVIFSSWGAFQTLAAMRPEHAAFAQKWDRVDAQIKQAKQSGLQEVHIPAMKNWAGAQYPTDNPKYYPNLCYSKFYDIEILAPPLAP